MGYLRSVAAARHRTISKLFAACLIALIVTPFTAPFAVCDAADFTQSSATHSHAHDSGKPAGETIDRVALVARFVASLRMGAAFVPPAPEIADDPTVIVRVLRI